MEKITSFTIDHMKLQPGLYVSRKDKVGSETVTTFDLRLTNPNEEPVMNTAEIHTMEHLAATYLRNEPNWKEKVLYFGPMGCRTGFYLLLAGAYAIRRLPYVMRSVSSGLEQTPVALEEAALSVGAPRRKVFTSILVPLLAANLLIGGLFAFSFSMLEVSDSLILVQKSAFYPITKAIFELSQILGSGASTASAFGVWTMVFMGSTLAAASAILGKKLGALFRF